jgi:uncharacterized spore protein YtfJ
MSAKDMIDGAIEHLRTSASVKAVYGDPIVTEGKTVIPVARVAFGFGGGSGSGMHHKPKPEPNGKDKKATAALEEEEKEAVQGEGGGGGGGVLAKPVGVVEITGEDTKFVQFGSAKKLAITALIGTALGLVAGMVLGRRTTN